MNRRPSSGRLQRPRGARAAASAPGGVTRAKAGQWRHAALVAIALFAGSCAGSGYVAQTPSMPAARAALRPEYRIFYDALQDYGDWVLIEPLGFVFRPRVDIATWRPYTEGFWAPSDSWGWVWVSAEAFGWATDHYGAWTYDRFQGWVWEPGVNWGPAWVTWQLADGYAGWAPSGSFSVGGSFGNNTAPGGNFVFVPLTQMTATDLKTHVVAQQELGAAAATAQPADRVVERDGERVNLGPSFGLIERAIGRPLPRLALQDLTPGSGTARAERGERDAVGPPASPDAAAIEATRRAAAAAAERARALTTTGAPLPERVPILRPAWIHALVSPGAHPRPAPAAPPDTTR